MDVGTFCNIYVIQTKEQSPDVRQIPPERPPYTYKLFVPVIFI